MSVLRFIFWFVCYFLFFSLVFVFPIRLIGFYIYVLFTENDIIKFIVGGLWLGAFIAQLYFSYKCGVIKTGSRIGFLSAIKIALKEFFGYMRLLVGR